MIQPIITGAESRSAWALDKTSLGAKEGGWELEAHGRKNSAVPAVPRWNGGRVLKKGRWCGDGGGGLGKLSAAAASVGVASPVLAASTQHTITFTPTPSPGPGSPSTPNTKPSAARLPKHAQRFRASRRQEGGGDALVPLPHRRRSFSGACRWRCVIRTLSRG